MENSLTALLGKGAEFEGQLVFEGVVRIDGNFKGSIFSRDTLIIGEDAKVKAEIEADVVVVSGELEGQIKATGRVEIHSTGNLKGDVTAPVIKIEEGGVLQGRTKMTPV